MVETWLSDVTEGGEPEAVLSMLDWQQRDDSVIFRDVTSFGLWSSPFFGPSDWASLDIRIWPEVLRAPHSGARTLKFAVIVRDELNESEVFYFHELEFRAELAEIGWLEFSERRQARRRRDSPTCYGGCRCGWVTGGERAAGYPGLGD